MSHSSTRRHSHVRLKQEEAAGAAAGRRDETSTFTPLFPVPQMQGSASEASIIQEAQQTKAKQARLATRLQPPSCNES